MNKRGNGEGSPHKRKDGTWAWPVMMGGKRRWFYGKTKAEAKSKYEAAKKQFEQGIDLGSANQTIAVYLQRWMDDVVYPTLRPRTAAEYASLIKKYINPAVGKLTLAELTPQHVQRMIKGLPKHLAPRSVRNVRAVLRRALNNALVWRLVSYNAAQGVAMPKVEKYKARIPTPEEAATLREAIKGIRLEALYLIAMFLGLRRGEVLGLLKAEVDTVAWELHITGQIQVVNYKAVRVTTKTEASKRTLPIPVPLRPYVLAALLEQPDSPLLFPSKVGTPILPRNLVTSFKRILRRAGLSEDIRFHDLRHFAATTLLLNGADISTTQAVLGHTDATTTLNFYAHALPNRTRVVVEDVVARVMGGDMSHQAQ